MATADVVDMQNAINRFATMAGFPPITASGIVDANTVNAFLHAMQVVQQDVPDESGNAATFIATASDPTSLTNSAAGYAVYLGQQADYLNLPAGVPSTPSITSVASATIPGAPLSTNIGLIWANLPLAVKIGGGILAAVGVVALAKHMRKPKKGRSLRGLDSIEPNEISDFDDATDTIN